LWSSSLAAIPELSIEADRIPEKVSGEDACDSGFALCVEEDE
jgi:hypothetical protein